MRRFTLSQLLVMVAAIAFCLGMYRILGWVLGGFFVALMLCYVLASFLSSRVRVTCAACASFFALLPWLGLGPGSFVLMGPADRLLPTIALPHVIYVPLSWVYWLAETPVYCISETSHEFADFLCFAGEGVVTVRPFAVFVFWLGIATALGLSIGTSSWNANRRRESEVKPTR